MSQTADPELDPGTRARNVDSTSPAAAALGTQAPHRSDADEDAHLRDLEAKHGVARGRGRGRSEEGTGSESRRGRTRAKAEEEEEETERADRFDPGKPITWDAKSKEKGVIRDEQGRFKQWMERGEEAEPERGEGEELEEELEEEDETPAEDLDGDGSSERDDTEVRMERAIKALRRDGWTEKELDKLSDKAVLRIGEKRARSQSDVDSRFAERSRDIQNGRRNGRERAREPEDDSAEPVTGDARYNATLDDAIEELEGYLVEGFADDALGQKTSAALRKVLGKATSISREARARENLVNELIEERVRTRLGERFPKLKSDDDLWARIANLGHSLLEAGLKRRAYAPGLRGIEQAFSDAARARLGDPLSRKERESRRVAHAARENGQLTNTRITAERAPFATLDRDQLETKWLQARERGDKEVQNELERAMERASRKR
jgi:hypothetical protein